MKAAAAIRIIAETPEVEAADGVLDRPQRPLLTPGQYPAAFETWSTYRMFGRAPKLVLRFVLMDAPGQPRVERFYNVKSLIGPARKRGRFKAGANSDFVKDYFRLAGRGARPDRFALSRLHGRVFIVTLHTVRRDTKQRDIPEALRYSVITEIRPE